MIVVDNSVLVPAVLDADPTYLVRRAAARDAIWILPPLWQFEFTNSMTTLAKRRVVSPDVARAALVEARVLVHNRVVAVDQLDAFRFALSLDISGYDAQYIALADAYGVRCVTNDRQLAARAGHHAMLLSEAV